jgi:hypothetical protein
MTSKTAHDRGDDGALVAPEPSRSLSHISPKRDLVLLALLLGGTAGAMVGGFRAPGSEFDEGIAVTFPDRVLHGAVPYRDFESFYGPANTYLTAAVFKVFGSTMYAERAIGFAVTLLIVLTLYILGRRFGRVAAFGAGVVGALLLAGEVVANAEHEAQACALLGLAATVAAATRTRSNAEAWFFIGGILGGTAALFRLEFLPATLLSALPLLLRGKWRRNTTRYFFGLAVALVPYAVVAAVVGGHKLRRNLDDLRETGRDRRLPFPGLASGDGRLLVIALLATVFLLAIAIWDVRKRGRTINGSLLLSGGLLAALTLPISFWRLDAPHIVSGCLFSFSFLPMAAATLDRAAPSRHDRRTWIVGGVTSIIVLFLMGSHAVRGNIHTNIRLALGKARGYRVSYRGRSFIISSRSAAGDLQAIVDSVAVRAQPSQTLFVGPRDLRRTNFNDVFVYYLLPQLRPASFNIELDPPASKPGSPLASELKRSDYLILSSRWDSWAESNRSRLYGSPAANAVVRDRFCVLERAGTYELLRRCR